MCGVQSVAKFTEANRHQKHQSLSDFFVAVVVVWCTRKDETAVQMRARLKKCTGTVPQTKKQPRVVKYWIHDFACGLPG